MVEVRWIGTGALVSNRYLKTRGTDERSVKQGPFAFEGAY